MQNGNGQTKEPPLAEWAQGEGEAEAAEAGEQQSDME